MKHTLLSTASAVVFTVLLMGSLPSAAMAATAADFEREVQQNILAQEAKSLEGLTGFERLVQEEYNALVRKAWDDLIIERKAYDAAVDKTGMRVPPTAPTLNEAQLRGQAEVRARAIQDSAQQASAQLSLDQHNQQMSEYQEAENARSDAWTAAANATLASITQQAIAKGINQASYDAIIKKALEELYASRPMVGDGQTIPATYSTPGALALLAQTESQKAWAAEHPDKCAGNPYSCGIVDQYNTLESTGKLTGSITTAGTSSGTSSGAITLALPALGETKALANGYTVNGEGVLKDAAGKTVAVLKENGTFVDANGNAVSADVANQYVGLFNTGSGAGDLDTKTGSGKKTAYAQKNSYVAETDKGEMVAIDESGSAGTKEAVASSNNAADGQNTGTAKKSTFTTATVPIGSVNIPADVIARLKTNGIKTVSAASVQELEAELAAVRARGDATAAHTLAEQLAIKKLEMAHSSTYASYVADYNANKAYNEGLGVILMNEATWKLAYRLQELQIMIDTPILHYKNGNFDQATLAALNAEKTTLEAQYKAFHEQQKAASAAAGHGSDSNLEYCNGVWKSKC